MVAQLIVVGLKSGPRDLIARYALRRDFQQQVIGNTSRIARKRSYHGIVPVIVGAFESQGKCRSGVSHACPSPPTGRSRTHRRLDVQRRRRSAGAVAVKGRTPA